jgi:Domain of unknown function (DUF4412)
MKKIFTVIWAALLLSSTTFAQGTFQGTMKYEFNFMGEGIESYQAMLPTGMEMKVLKTDVLLEVQGGMAAMAMGRTLAKTKTGITYMIKDSEETIYVMDPSKDKKDEEPAADPVVTKEDEVITIAGYECQKYTVVSQSPQGESTSYVWVTEKFSIPKAAQGSGSGMSGMLDIKGVKGTPLKVMTTQMGMTVTITAKEISTTAPDKKLFKLPKGYAKEPFDMEKMMGGM